MELNQFFAVTQRSLYRVGRGARGLVHIEKLGGVDNQEIPVGDRMEGFDHVDVTRFGIFHYTDTVDDPPQPAGRMHSQRPGPTSKSFWDFGTSAIVALFLDQAEAESCAAASNRMPLDPRWHTQTKATVAAIGEYHPSFKLSRYPELAI